MNGYGHGYGLEGSRAGAVGTGATRWACGMRRLVLVALIGAASHLASSERARADDSAGLLRTADGAGPALVTAQRTATADETSPGAGIPVLVVIDDEEPVLVKRSSGIAKRMLEALAGSMSSVGLRMVDAESVAGDLGREIPDRIATRKLLNILKDMGESDEAEHVHHAWVLLRLHVSARLRYDTASLRIRVNAEIRTAPDGLFLDALEPPPVEYPIALGCLESPECVAEFAGERARDIADVLAENLSHRLRPFIGLSGAAIRTSRYVLTLRNVPEVEAYIIAGTLASEFPGHRSLDLIRNSPGATRSYEYLTDATAAKLEQWFGILLRDMGYDPGSDVTITLDRDSIVIERLEPPAIR